MLHLCLRIMRWYFYFSYDLHVLKEHMKQCVYHEFF